MEQSGTNKSSHYQTSYYDDKVEGYTDATTTPLREHIVAPCVYSYLDLKDLNVVDLGCGTGYFTRGIAERGAGSVTGADINDAMLEEARNIEQRLPLGNVKYVLCDATSDMEDLQGADLVTSMHVLNHAQDVTALEGMCSTAYQCLRPGGRFVTATNINGCVGSRASPRIAENLGVRVDWEGELKDGMAVTTTLFSAKSKCSIPDVLWSKETMEKALLKVGFVSVKWIEWWPENEQARRLLNDENTKDVLSHFYALFDAKK